MEVKNLMSASRSSLKGNWGIAIAGFLIYAIIIGVISSLLDEIGSLITLLIAGPFALGMAIFTLELSREGDPKIEMIFKGFNDFVRALISYLLMILFILLWALLLIVPGIIAGISYSMTFFILAEDPSIKPMDAIDKSKAMMDGYKWKMFELGIYLFLLSLLCILTLGIGFLWLMPYGQVSCAKFYKEVKDNYSSKSGADENENTGDSSSDNSQNSVTPLMADSRESDESASGVDEAESSDNSNESDDSGSKEEDDKRDNPTEE